MERIVMIVEVVPVKAGGIKKESVNHKKILRCSSNLDKSKSKSDSNLGEEEEMIMKRSMSGGKIDASLCLLPVVR